MIRLDQWYEPNFSLLGLIYWCTGTRRMLYCMRMCLWRLWFIFFPSQGLSMSLQGTKHRPFLTSDSFMVSICTNSAVLLCHPAWVLFQPRERGGGLMSCCPNLDSEDFLILGAWHLVASSYTKLVNAQLPRLHQHEHVTVTPENNREPSMGRWGIATAPACRDQVCERSVSLAVLSAS